MASPITLTIKAFGLFRQFANLTLSIPMCSTLIQVRTALAEKLIEVGASSNDIQIVNHSAFAIDDHIIEESFVFQNNAELSVLPPVCGG